MAPGQGQRQTPAEILAKVFDRAVARGDRPVLADEAIQQRIEYVSRTLLNRAGVRLLMACLLAKLHNPDVDVRKPYTEIGTPDSFSGRSYDETYLSTFILQHSLPCNPTTAFLTPALRNRNTTLTPGLNLVGRPAVVYEHVLQLLTDVHEGRVSADDALTEAVRCLLIMRDAQRLRMETLLSELQATSSGMPLSSEGIVTLIEQHLAIPKSSRLIVLAVAAAYQAVAARMGERVLPLLGHLAADRQTGALGDLQVALVGDGDVVTAFEMKDRRVTRNDIDAARAKVMEFYHRQGKRIDNYLFITTEAIDLEVRDYARTHYDQTGGIEFAVLDCISFLRHFLHLFHRVRVPFLEAYQQLVLAEPDSAVGQPVKEAFLSLRRAAESQLNLTSDT